MLTNLFTFNYYIDGDKKDSYYVSGGLDAGKTKTTYFSWEADKCGKVQKKAKADATNAVTESEEGDNTKIKTLNVECPEPDSDGDGIIDSYDKCPFKFDPDQRDSDSDGVGDACDNCQGVYNPGQEDSNGDGIGDACSESSPYMIIEDVLVNYESDDPLNFFTPLLLVAEERPTIGIILKNTGTQNFNGGDGRLRWDIEDTDTSPITPVKEGNWIPNINIPPIPSGSCVSIVIPSEKGPYFTEPSMPDQLNIYLNIYSEGKEYKTNTFNKKPIFIWPKRSDWIDCTLVSCQPYNVVSYIRYALHN